MENENFTSNPKDVENVALPVPQVIPDGRTFTRKSVNDDKTTGISSSIMNNSITQAMLQNAIVGQSQLKYQQVSLAFGSADTSKTATVVSGAIIIGVYSSTVTSTPAYGELQLVVSGTTLTGTRSAAPGGAAAVTYTITLLKV